jgi:hypothetical protein
MNINGLKHFYERSKKFISNEKAKGEPVYDTTMLYLETARILIEYLEKNKKPEKCTQEIRPPENYILTSDFEKLTNICSFNWLNKLCNHNPDFKEISQRYNERWFVDPIQTAIYFSVTKKYKVIQRRAKIWLLNSSQVRQ